MPIPPSDYVRPLNEAENRYLQVLVNRFELKRIGDKKGSRLSFSFAENSPAIWAKQGKEHLELTAPNRKSREGQYQESLDNVLVKGVSPSYSHDDDDFPFRYANGGTLPIIQIGSQQYYCLIYREIKPIGWNIANGGSDTREEMLDPFLVVERELREELIMVNPSRNAMYRFEGDFHRPEFDQALALMRDRFTSFDVSTLDSVEVPLEWIDGPDQLAVTITDADGSRKQVELPSCFLNINAVDMGIEIDRVAIIHVDESTILIDGEIADNQRFGDELINSVIGLFSVDRVNETIHKTNEDPFFPDLFFHSGQRVDRHWAKSRKTSVEKEFIRTIEEDYVPSLIKTKSITSEERNRWEGSKQPWDLCPVTRRIIRRYRDFTNAYTPSFSSVEPHDILVCATSNDAGVAEEICRYVGEPTNSNPFLFIANEDNQPFSNQLNEAIEKAQYCVVVASAREYMDDPRIKRICLQFDDAIRSRRKPYSARLIPFVTDWAKSQSNDIVFANKPIYFAVEEIEFQYALSRLAHAIDTGIGLRAWIGDDADNCVLVFTDIKDSTDFSTEWGTKTWTSHWQSHYKTAYQYIRKHTGYLIKELGDGLMTVFRSCENAIRFASHITDNSGVHEFIVRAGVHKGTGEITDDDVLGPPVNKTSRYCGAAENGGTFTNGIVLTECPEDIAKDNWIEVKNVQLKGFPEPENLFYRPPRRIDG